ncbi:hypothetical protein FOA43_002865 [Brettanomyces nanus]|uniref:Aminotransferase class V domain-containing protein n=1 Tax=Eeniella nana TaxID=13502 RepID=A0A875RPV7_EENNA|nr:uncharacterized protein FOA43_002865 [Brettanomyces nanus]QPG75510.1 hypothetical protein FOA43_002865 [Brettanomyces nanus]
MFGKSFRDRFLFPSEVVPLNHGSFGAVPRRVYQSYQQAIYDDLKFPDQFMFSKQAPEMEKSVKLVARVLNTDFTNLALIPNASTGINIVFRDFPFVKGDTVILTSIIYGACGNTVDYVVNRYGLNLKVIDIKLPSTEQAILGQFKEVFEETRAPGKAICIYDAICSMPGIRMPFELITRMCKQYGITSCVDGAHSIGMLNIDLSAIDCDFYTSNMHKWMYLPRGCAVLFVNPRWHDYIMPFPISHTYKNEPFYKRFIFYGSNNYNSFYCIKDALDFIQEDCGGFEKIREYCKGLSDGLIAHFGQDRIVKVDGATGDDLNFMVTVKVPLDQNQHEYFANAFKDKEHETKLIKFVENESLQKYKTFIQFGWHNNFMYVRFSCQIYNDLHEYFWGYERFEEVMKNAISECN